MFGDCLENVRKTAPLVHNITNYVTVNDVANVLLACGGSPIMSDEPEDVAEITSICGGLNINIGTLNKRSIEGMFLAGAKGQRAGSCGAAGPGRRRRQRPAHQYSGLALMEKIEAGRDPWQYFGDQNPGFGQRHHQRRGRGCRRYGHR